MNKKIWGVLITLIITFEMLCCGRTASADNEITIKIGYIDYAGFIERNDDSYSGYGWL